MIDKLRDEIIESEKARTDLIKWKLILVAAIGVTGLGIGTSQPGGGHPAILLALIPFVCLYVDVVCYHNEIRIVAIAQFFRTGCDNTEARKYEEDCLKNRSGFSLEPLVLLWTTFVLSCLVLLIGMCEDLQTVIGIPRNPKDEAQTLVLRVLIWAGVFGIVGGFLIFLFYRYRIDGFDDRKCRTDEHA